MAKELEPQIRNKFNRLAEDLEQSRDLQEIRIRQLQDMIEKAERSISDVYKKLHQLELHYSQETRETRYLLSRLRQERENIEKTLKQIDSKKLASILEFIKLVESFLKGKYND